MLGSTRESLVNSKKGSDISLKQPCEMLRFFFYRLLRELYYHSYTIKDVT